MSIQNDIAGTREHDILSGMGRVYTKIDSVQSAWKKASGITCPDGCGCCCVDFEPDVLESEAVYLAAWMLENQKERAQAIIDGTFIPPRPASDKGCFLFNPDSPYHCTVYGGRCLICRLFGYSGDYGKLHTIRFKPCRFLAAEKLACNTVTKDNGSIITIPVEHRQYEAAELTALFGTLPPAMSDIMEQALSLTPESAGDTLPLREALPAALRKLQFVIALCSHSDEPQTA